MTGIRTRRRGQPLAVFAALMIGWIGLRVVLWETPFIDPLPQARLVDSGPVAPSVRRQNRVVGADSVFGKRPDLPESSAIPLSVVVGLSTNPIMPPSRVAPVMGPRTIAAHQFMWMAAMAGVPVRTDATLLPQSRKGPDGPVAEAALVRQAGSRSNRWSLDGWVFYRPQNGSTVASPGARPAGYGGSQAGAVIRYRLRPASGHRPTAYLRATQALSGGRASELAAGLAARPLPRMPLSAQAELRVTRSGRRTEIRPAALVVSELPPQSLPAGLNGEAYIQAGYVGGDFATAFADGHARVTRSVARFDLGELRAGGGAWGGAQKGVARLDVGPTASLDVKVGDVPARLAVDYRHRVAGDAAPESGLALTLSTGF